MPRIALRTMIRQFWITVLLLAAQSATAQSGPPFGCTGDIYQVQSGQLRIFDPITSSYQDVGAQNGSYNASGYNILDNYAYASQRNNIIRIASDGTLETVYNIGFGSYSGDVDFSNNYWLRRNNLRYAKIDLATGTFVNVDFTGANNGPADVAYDQFGGQEYLIGFSSGRLYRYNITTLVKENVSISGLPSGGYGATWTDFNGRLFTFNNNTGLLFEIFDYYTNAPTAVQVGVGVPSGNNDGFSCSLSPFPNLAPVAFDDDFSTPVNTPVSGNVIFDNGNGTDSDPDGGPVTVTTTPLSGPSNGMVTLNADGSFTYTPDTYFFGVDTFEYEITDQAGLTATAVVTITVVPSPDFTVTKTQVSGPNPVTAPGVLEYEIQITNTGDIPLTGVVAADTFPDGSSATLSSPVETGAMNNVSGQLDVDETWTYTTNYSVTQSDIDDGSNLINNVDVTTTETGATVNSDDASTPITQSPSLTIDKSVDEGLITAPGTLTYTIDVVNTGNQSLTGVSLVDTVAQNGGGLPLASGPILSGGDTDSDNEIDVDETWTFTVTFAATQDQIDNGADIVNTATVTTDQTPAQNDTATTSITRTPAFEVAKTSDTPVLSAPGTITYEIELTNTGNVSVTGLSPTDTLTQGATPLTLSSGLVLSGDTDSDLELDVGETWIYSATYDVGQEQIDDGGTITNAVSISSTNAGSESSQTSTTIAQSPALTIDKSVDVDTITAPGTLTFTISVENTGNVSLTSVNLTDDLSQSGTLGLTTGPNLSGDDDLDGEIDVGETWVYTATFDVGQTEIDDGGDIVNLATVDTAETTPQNDNATTTVDQTDALGLAKSVASGELSSFDEVGDSITFTFVVTNTGNTTRRAPITIDDDQIGNGLACSAGDLAPGASISCDHVWTADQDDLNAGSVTNTATAEDNEGIVSDPAQATVIAVQSPALAIIKDIVAPVPTVFQSGETLFYEYEVTNTGNVTITEPITVTDNLATVTCPDLPVVGLVPTASITCTASYVLTSNDEKLGSTTNVANAETTFNGEPVTSPSDSAIFPVDALPVIDLQKSAPVDPVSTTTDEILYSYRIENVPPPPPSVGAALTEIIYINDDKFADPIVCYDPAVDGGSFLPGDVHVCNATYTVTQDDLDAGEVLNEATANTVFAPASPSPINVVSNIDTFSVPVDAQPGLTTVKSVTAGNDPADVGDEITYQIVTRNSGNQTLSNVSISDSLLGALVCDLTAPVTLAPGAALTCTGAYTVQQSDIDAQTVGDASSAVRTNTATANATNPAGTAIDPSEDTVEHPLLEAVPAVTVVKQLFPDPNADPAYTDLDDVVQYQMIVTNSGNMTLSLIDVTDSLVPGICSVGPLAPGESDSTCTFDYVITQADIDAGQVVNVASASAQPIDPSADPVVDDDTLNSPGPDFAGSLEVVKAGSLDLGADGVATVGDVISYTLTVSNTGNVTLTEIGVTDPNADSISFAPADDTDGNNTIDSLAPGTSATVTAVHALTQNDINTGQVTNTATATGSDPAGDPVSDDSDSADAGAGPGDADPTVTPIPRVPGLAIEKSHTAASGTGAGDIISYSYRVENTGNVTLTDVTLTDKHTSASGTSPLTISGGGVIPTLAPGAIVTLTATYEVTQADVDAGDPLTNTVTAISTAPTGTASPMASDDDIVEPEAADPVLEVLKTVRQAASEPGDTVIFEVTVENTGNVTLSNVIVSDDLRRTDNTPILPDPVAAFESGAGDQANLLDVGETWVYTVSHVLTQDDIDAGGLRNSATADATAPDGTPVTDVSDNGTGDGDDPTVMGIIPNPSIEAIKTITSSTIEVGQTVTFAIEVENTGNVTFSNVQIASDTLTRADGTLLSITGPGFAGANMGSLEGTLQVGETATYTASYVLVQDDIDAGGIENTAVAQASPPFGSQVTDTSDDDGAGSDPTVLTIPASPEIGLEKRLAAGGPTFDTVGAVLSYEFEITNLGNVTLSAPYVLDDPLITDAGGVVTCPSNDIAPGESVVCTGDYAVIQEDIDAGSVDNTATATVGDAAPVDASESVPAQQNPAIELVKTPQNVEPEDFIVGAEVTYTFTSTNTGNVTLTTPIEINDTLIPASAITCDPWPGTGLAPGDSYECKGSYTVTSDDVQIASVTNLATASDGTTTSPIDSAVIPNDGEPALSIDKELITSLQPDGSDSGTLSFEEVGDQLEFQFTVTNTGQVSFARDVEVIDTFFDDPIACYVPDASNPDLIPGEVTICTAIYTITQGDLDAGEVVNEAYARTDFGSIPTLVQSEPDTATTPADADPMVSIVKSADRTEYTAINEVVTFSFEVTNTGNQTLTSVEVTDPLLPGLVCEVATLAVDDVLLCSADYTITQANIDRGSLTNTASATGIDPRGASIPVVSDDVTLDGPRIAPTLDIVKIANPDPFGEVGSAITYTFQVTNTSIYTMSNVTVTDPLAAFTCTVGTMSPGQVNSNCQVVVPVTQGMVDDGELENTATVTGDDPFGNEATAVDTIITDGPDEAPAIEVVKLADVPATSLASKVSFRLIVTNPGNVSLGMVTINDQMLRNDGSVITLDAPFAFTSGDVNFDGLLNPTETWIYGAAFTITQDDINAGGFSNSVEVTGTSPSGTPVSDTSDNGNDVDGNDKDDPTVVMITTDPVLNVTKVVSTGGTAVGDEVVFEIQAANTGNVDIFNVGVSDTLTRADGTDLSGDIVGPTRISTVTDNGDTTLSPAEVWAWEVRYTLTQDDIDAGGIENSATATGADFGGASVTDTSDDGDDTDGNITDDPTVLSVAPEPGLDTVKTLVSVGSAAGEEAVFEIRVANTGNVTLSDIAFADTMTNLDGTQVGPLTTVVDGLTSDGALLVGETAVYTVTYVLQQADVDSGGLSNTATASGVTPGGLTVSDTSDDGDDTDGNTLDDPTIALIEALPSAEATKDATIPNRVAPNLYQVTFTMTLTNTGNVTLSNITAIDDLSPFVAPTVLTAVGPPVVTGFATNAANTSYNGVSDTNMLGTGVSLAPGETGTIELFVEYSTEDGFPQGSNTVSFVSEELPAETSADVTIEQGDTADILATKTATPTTAILGDTITYTLTFLNQLPTAESNLTIVDDLPAGLVYTPGTAEIDGVASEPAMSGRRLSWSPIALNPNQTVTVTFAARLASEQAGEYVNHTFMQDPGGNTVSNVATATIARRPEAVFDCADIIGKVFDDKNHNGHQDGVDTSAITNQTYDKFDFPPEPKGERGIPNVRLSTVSGTLITTDEFGRFSVPCAELPGGIGSNFQLKLDTRTLPTGYHVTTENPRNVRVTAGKVTRLNFGATLSTLVEVDLTAAAFDGNKPVEALEQWLPTLVARMQREPSVLRLTYYRGSEDQRTATERLNTLERALRAQWRGRDRLIIERIVNRIQ